VVPLPSLGARYSDFELLHRESVSDKTLRELQKRVKRLEKLILVLLSKIKHVDGEDVTGIMNCIESMENEDVTLRP